METESEVDGVAFAEEGPVLLHGYDPPAEGMWLDDVIPGKLWALDRQSGQVLWHSACEVGYGRGFGAGFDAEGAVCVLGPSLSGHRIVRMARDSGRLLGALEVEPFDEAHVGRDVAICVTPGALFAVGTTDLEPRWRYSREGERYRHVGRSGDRALVVFTDGKTQRHGLLALDAATGEPLGRLLEPTLEVVHGLATSADECILLTADIAGALPRELATQFLTDLALHEEDEVVCDTLTLLAFPASGEPGEPPLWYDILSTAPVDELPEASIGADAGKLYLVRGALLEARDSLTGRVLGSWTVPGLDQHVSWCVVDGAGLLAEEHRVSVFELPA